MILNRLKTESFLDREFSLVRNIKAKFSAETVSLREFIERIQTGTWKNNILLLRKDRVSNSEKAKTNKSNLPAAKFHGVFSGHRAIHLMNCSGLICLDFDDVGGGEAIDSLKASVSKDPSVVCAFVSPSGEGLKVVIVSGAESVDEHKECWNAAKDVFTGYVDPQSSAKLDSAPSNISGNCFVSYDPNIYLNEAAVPFRPKDDCLVGGGADALGFKSPVSHGGTLCPGRTQQTKSVSQTGTLCPTSRTQQTTTSEVSVVSEVSISQPPLTHWDFAELGEKGITELPPALRGIYKRFISKLPVNPGQRFDLLQKLIKPLFRTCGMEQALRLVELHYETQAGIWTTSKAEHLKDAQAAWERAEADYPKEELSDTESVIYENLLSERQKAGFRICLNLAMLGGGSFFMSMNHLGERTGIKPQQAKRVLLGFRSVGAIELYKEGRLWKKGEKPRAHTYLWAAERPSPTEIVPVDARTTDSPLAR